MPPGAAGQLVCFVYNAAMSAALGLLRLQKVDSSINQIQARLEHIRETLENDAELAAARARVENAESRAG